MKSKKPKRQTKGYILGVGCIYDGNYTETFKRSDFVARNKPNTIFIIELVVINIGL